MGVRDALRPAQVACHHLSPSRTYSTPVMVVVLNTENVCSRSVNIDDASTTDRIARRCVWKAALPPGGFVLEGTINHSLAVDTVVEAVQMDQKESVGTYLKPLKERQVKMLAE